MGGAGTSVRRCRTLHLVDADNLLGDPTTVDYAYIAAVFAEYRRAARFEIGDHVVVATGLNARHVLAIERLWPNACHRRRAGPDGADLALLEAADWAARSRRFGRVVIGSGDRIFAVAVEQLRAAGVVVDVVSRPRALARCLEVRARGRVRHLRPVRSGA